jgi:hypothetical protein
VFKILRQQYADEEHAWAILSCPFSRRFLRLFRASFRSFLRQFVAPFCANLFRPFSRPFFAKSIRAYFSPKILFLGQIFPAFFAPLSRLPMEGFVLYGVARWSTYFHTKNTNFGFNYNGTDNFLFLRCRLPRFKETAANFDEERGLQNFQQQKLERIGKAKKKTLN